MVGIGWSTDEKEVTMEAFIIGIDMGGTRIKGVLQKGKEVVESIYLPTGEGDTFKNSVRSAVEQLQQKCSGQARAIGLSAPGIPDSTNRAIAVMPGRLPGLEGFQWTEFLGLPSFVLNDAVCALLAEAKSGAAVGQKNVVLLTLGTGVGGAILIDGKPYQGAFNKAGHWGHTSVEATGYPDVTGMPGSIEEAIGNVSVARRSQGRFRDTQELLNGVEDNDPFAQWLWLDSVQKLAVTISGISNAVSPDVIVLGGGIAHAGEILLTPLRRFMDIYEWRPSGKGSQIVKAIHSDLAGAVGAAFFAHDMNHTQSI
jgi:glucokinase